MIGAVTLFLLGLATAHGFGLGQTQSAGARGVLLCHGQRQANVQVKLFDDDRGLDTDDLLAAGKTDANGYFQLSGHTTEFSPIDPKLNIYHDCANLLPCKRKVTLPIPDSYISKGKNVKSYFDVHYLELSEKFPGETRDCIH